jgi:hypothetical protein
MIVNLAELRRQRPSPPPPEFDASNPGRRNRLSLEQQKKRAKDLLRAVRSNDHGAVARFQLRSPESLLTGQSPRLNDAQQVIARENGFRKWTDLKAHIDRIEVELQATVEGRPSALDGDEKTLHIRCGTDILHDLALGDSAGISCRFRIPMSRDRCLGQNRCRILFEFARNISSPAIPELSKNCMAPIST